MTVQVGLCRTCSKTTLLVFPRGSSYDGSQWISSTGTCSSDQWQCSDHTCISKDAVCNGVINCPSQDDEADCCKWYFYPIIKKRSYEQIWCLFFIAPAYNRVRYRSPNFCPSVRSFVRPSVRQHLRRSLVFSTSVIAASLKPCIVIVPDIPFKHAP